MLPGIQHIRSPEFAEGGPGDRGTVNGDPTPGERGGSTLEHTHRLREIAIQEMTEASARARLGRALNTKSTPAAQKMNLQVGDEVDFYKAPIAKGIPGWHGPATVIDTSGITRGVISLKWNSKVMEVQTQRVRRHLHSGHC